MKTLAKRLLQKLLGLEAYLLLFAVFRVLASRIDPREKGLYQFIKLLPAQPLVLDVGANIGVTTTIIQQESREARVVAFEPIPINLLTLRRLFKFFHIDAQVIACAVGNSAMPIEMVLPKKNGVFFHGLSHLKDPADNPHDEGMTSQVEMIRLDDSRQLWGGGRVHGIKLDVENSESLVLAGATHLLQTDRPVIYCELWDNDNRRRCIDLAHELGYSVNVLAQGKLQPYDSSWHNADNFFLLPQPAPSALN